MILFVTPGDPQGIGPEITLKALQSRCAAQWRHEGARLVCVGAAAPFRALNARLRLLTEQETARLGRGENSLPQANREEILFIAAPKVSSRGRLLQGYQSGWSIAQATRLVLGAPATRALVTGPISKVHLRDGGFSYPGHTEFLADLCGVRGGVTMMLANDLLRVSLVTIHARLSHVPALVTRSRIERALLHTEKGLRSYWNVKTPRIAVAALNPHAGEGGLLGSEEQKKIIPAITAVTKLLGRTAEIVGPIPADTLFAQNLLASRKKRFDAVVCMYHDQGLIPVKLLDFNGTVNVTLGLPIVRTSVDHGVAFDIAGKNVANPSSLIAAITLAVGSLKKSKRLN